jgi:chemotaxis protein CheZ
MAFEIKLAAGDVGGRGVQRKIFRVEQMFPAGRAAATGAAGAAEHRQVADELKTLRTLTKQLNGTETSGVESLQRELALIHDTIARNKRELASLIGEGKERRMARSVDELRAAVDGMDYATQKILKSVEVIDESARALTATLKDDYKRGVAQDIQDHVVQIYEACNFQDIAGQRISNVIGTMTMVEDQVAAMLDRCDALDGRNEALAQSKPARGPGLLNGPKLDGDSGHASQRDIDEMFG